jgi:hypothetical protein
MMVLIATLMKVRGGAWLASFGAGAFGENGRPS